MIDFTMPVRFRGKHAAYVQYLCTERGQKREGGVNIFNRVMDAYLAAIIVGLKYNRTAPVDDSIVKASEIFGKVKGIQDKKISSSDINAETVHGENDLLNYLYRLVMLCENERNLTAEEKIANAFKSEGNQNKIKDNIELMNQYARGGVEILYERFAGLAKDEQEIAMEQLNLFDELGSLSDTQDYES